MSALAEMTHATWSRMSPAEKDAARDLSDTSPDLIGLEGCRVEVVDQYDEKRRFWVGISTGWRPCHLEIKTSRSSGGGPADKSYKSVRVVDGRNRQPAPKGVNRPKPTHVHGCY